MSFFSRRLGALTKIFNQIFDRSKLQLLKHSQDKVHSVERTRLLLFLSTPNFGAVTDRAMYISRPMS